MATLGLFVLVLLFQYGTTLPTLCNNQKFDDHRHLYGQTKVPCHVFRPGTCLVVSPEKVDISVAQMECTYKYGGQLVVPKNVEEVKTIVKKLFYHHSVPSDYADSKFFLGLIGNKDYADLRIDAKKYSNTLEEGFWSRVMMSPTTSRIERSEYPFADGQKQLLSGEKVNQPAVGTCVDKVIGLNPTTAKFEVLNGNDKHYYLCETPRWPKYKCPQGYLLDRSQPMCFKAYVGEWHLFNARKKCREEKSVIAASRRIAIKGYTYAVFLIYLLNEDISIPSNPEPHFYISGINHFKNNFCDDGSGYCGAPCAGGPHDTFATSVVKKTGVRDDPYQKSSYCEPGINSAALLGRKRGVICSVRPDQTE